MPRITMIVGTVKTTTGVAELRQCPSCNKIFLNPILFNEEGEITEYKNLFCELCD